MFDIGAAELLVIVVVAVIVIGPKDLPKALRTAGGWIGKVRRVSAHFRSGIDTMIREAELEEMEQKWKARNEEIMARSGSNGEKLSDEMIGPPPAVTAESAATDPAISDETEADRPTNPADEPTDDDAVSKKADD